MPDLYRHYGIDEEAIFRVGLATLPASLKRFKPRQTRRGVSAAPWKQRRVFPGTFIVASLGGHVFARKGDSGRAIRPELIWGVIYMDAKVTASRKMQEWSGLSRPKRLSVGMQGY